MTLSDQHPWIFICSTIYYGAFPHTFFSSDELLLKNGTVSPAQRLKFWPPQLLLLLFIFENHEKKWNWFELKDRELLLLFLDCEDGELLNSLRKHNTFSLTFVSFNKQSHFRLIVSLREDIAGILSSKEDIRTIVKYSKLSNEYGKQPYLNNTCKIISQFLNQI